ncbi:MAG TPA: methyltransferase [Miltoncostaeaceae bacterium]|nr:methyltransferase [Miltoncostaeaceae bacterium]
MPPASRNADWRETLTALAALETGLLAAFRDGDTPEHAAHVAGVDPRGARIVATALADVGLLEPGDAGALRTTARGTALLEPAPGGADPAGALFLEARAIRSHLALADTLRTGAAPDDVSAGDRATRERFMRAMRDVTAPRIPEVLAAVGPPPPGGRLLDVGGAPGVHARAFAGEGWDVTVLDLPGTLEIGADDLRAAGVTPLAGDATAGLPDGPWDAVHLGNIAHLLDRAAAAALVARAGGALRPGGLLLIGEVLGDRSPQGPGFGVAMLVSTAGGDAWTADDYRGWMAAAGAPLERIVAVQGGLHHLLIGRRA